MPENFQEITLAGLSRGKLFEKASFYRNSFADILRTGCFSEDLDFTLNSICFTLENYIPFINESFTVRFESGI
jgi:hypothetical protein